MEYTDNNAIGAIKEKDGKCYEKCYLPLKKVQLMASLPAYTGKNNDIEGVKLEKIEISPATTKWVKQLDKNCRSLDPSQCSVWCLVEVPVEYVSFYMVTDTNLVKDFVMRPVIVKQSVPDNERKKDWVEIVCPSEQNAVFNTLLNTALKNRGYLQGRQNTAIDAIRALGIFQREHNLPVGGYNLPTMQRLKLQ